jgi:tRNA (cytidine56-2'-O)-methyltransferase
MIEVLRLSHRISRDHRISTHLALTSRALGVEKFHYTGQKDKELEESISKVVERFGGPFSIQNTKEDIKLINDKKKQGYKIIHLTMYGQDFRKPKKDLINKNMLIIIGGEKVEPEYYQLADYNLSVGNQPHSELGALSIVLYEYSELKENFKDAKIKVIPKERGKFLKEL